MENLRERLGRVRNLIGALPVPEVEESTSSHSRGFSEKRKAPARYLRLATFLDGELLHSEDGSFCRVTAQIKQSEVSSLRAEHLFRLTTDIPANLSTTLWPESVSQSEIPLESIAFVDTETTGLGGSGAVPFMIGIGWYRGSSFVVDQYLLPDYADEAAMLAAVRDDLRRALAVVTYNGASFDIPLLRDRFVLHRIEKNYQPSNHLDLLHLSRRVFRSRLRDCSLGNLEKAVLGHERIDDTPGYLIPATYFEWLNNERAEPLAGVLRHNADDIISLAALFQFLHEAVATSGESLSRSDDLYGLARFFQHRRKPQAERQALRIIHHDRPESERRPPMMLAYARGLKKSGMTDEAMQLWHSVAAGESLESLLALRQLAIAAEHHQKDYPASLSYVERARELIGHLNQSNETLPKGLVHEFSRRKDRLLRRLSNSR